MDGNNAERRWATRMPVRVAVDLSFQGAEITDCLTRDIGFGGVYIEMPPPVPPLDTSVQITFKLASATPAGVTRFAMPARVVRLASDGVGMIFSEFDAASFRSLREVLRYREPTAG